MTIEDLLVECGGLGKYQLLIIFGISTHIVTLGWSNLQMSFAGYIPDWYCVVGQDTSNQSFYTNHTLKMCSLNNSDTGYQDGACKSYWFEGSSNTVVTEWGLVCDLKLMKATITSSQMAGNLVGAILAGQVSALIGRKKTLFGFSLFHSLVNIVAAFSTTWEMFAALRFLIGIGIAGLQVVIIPYQLEFITLKWRPLVCIIPVWSISVALFSGAVLVLDDWSHIHMACGLVGLPAMLSYIFVPESVRWLTTQGRYREAENIFAKMAMINGATLPSQTRAILENIYMKEQHCRSNGRTYSYWDLFTSWKQAKVTLVFGYIWFMMAMVFYGIAFGVSALAGNLYLNIFLLSIIQLPVSMSTFYFNNNFIIYSSEHLITGLSLTAIMGIGPAWSVAMIWSTGSYPTVVRSLGYGILNSVARVGGILAPFIVDLDDHPMSAYIVITSMVVLAILLSSSLPETKGQLLEDSQNVPSRIENDTMVTKTARTDEIHRPSTDNNDKADSDDVFTQAPLLDDGCRTRAFQI